MVPPAVGWSGQPVALVDEIQCSFNGVERQPGQSATPAGNERWPEFPCFSLHLREKIEFAAQFDRVFPKIS
jgi:hypothetical protein